VKKKKKQDGGGGGAPAWMVTYSDMVTLLLTFFVLLLSMARLDKVLFRDAAGSLRGAFGVMNSTQNNEVAVPKIIEFSPIDDDYVARVYKRVQTHIKRLKLDRDIELVKDRGAVILRVKDSILFDSGSVVVKSDAHPVLQKISQLVKPLPFGLRIEGHTDNVPPTGGNLTNWDISMMRAVNVLKFFVQEDIFPLHRMSAVGYGAQKPVVQNDSPEQRNLNRRVEFVMESLNEYRSELPYLIDANEQAPF
jgi:chemotaxis protein MotB